MPPMTIPIDFSAFQDGTVLGPQFTLGGCTFRDSGAPPSFVKAWRGMKGLQFPDAGLRVQLPGESSLVRVRAVAGAKAFKISWMDGGGNVLSQAIIAAGGQPQDVELAHPGILYVDFAGGDNEGMLLVLSFTFP